MSRVVLLDSGPLGMVTNAHASPVNLGCTRWLRSLLESGIRIIVPEIADYEVRRELVRAGRMAGLGRLDGISTTPGIRNLPITTAAMRRAAEFWADARRRGRPTADAKALDGDVILAAQAALLQDDGDEPVIATTNVAHLGLFVQALFWDQVRPN